MIEGPLMPLDVDLRKITSLILSILISKKEIIIVPPSQGYIENLRYNSQNA